MGEGATACIKLNCSQSHRGGNKLILPFSGKAYVMKFQDKVFVEPHANIIFFYSDVVNDWIHSKKNMNEWVDIFNATKNHIP